VPRVPAIPSLVAVLCAAAYAQSIEVRSEFQRFDPFGEVVAADRTEHPREIISPAVVRNAYATFQVAVRSPLGKPAFVFVQQNPDNTVQPVLYKECFEHTGEGWIPDRLEKVKLPHFDILPQPESPIPGQTTLPFLLDLWVPATARAGRMRLEIVLKAGPDWIIYPMELRVQNTVLTGPAGPTPDLPNFAERADSSALACLRAWRCDAGQPFMEGSVPQGASATIRSIVRRNARQDLSLARALASRMGRDAFEAQLNKLAGVAGWCGIQIARPPFPTEWYLRFRDFLYRNSQ
jgi:hypothetical protein